MLFLSVIATGLKEGFTDTELLDVVILSIGDVEVATGVYGDSLQPVKLPGMMS